MDHGERRFKLLQSGLAFLESGEDFALINWFPEVFIVFSLYLCPAISYHDTLDAPASSYQLSQKERMPASDFTAGIGSCHYRRYCCGKYLRLVIQFIPNESSFWTRGLINLSNLVAVVLR